MTTEKLVRRSGAWVLYYGNVDNAVVTPPSAPTAAFTSKVTGLSVLFDASNSFDPSNTSLTYTWTFGDGSVVTTTAKTYTKQYSTANSFNVTLSVKNAAGLTGTLTQQVTTTAATTDTFLMRETKPVAANTGHGLLKDAAGAVRPVGTGGSRSGGTVGSLTNQTVNGDITITAAGTKIVDCVINGKVSIQAPNVLVENCVIWGPASAPSSTVYVINANNSAAASGPALVRFCTIKGRWKNPNINACGQRNITVERCDISQVVDGFSPNPSSTSNNAQMIVRGNYVHDFILYYPDPGHNATPRTGASGQYIVGPSGAVGTGWTHCDAVQVESDLTTGVNIYGNNFVALWSSDPAVSSLPFPYDANGNTVIKELSCFMLNGGRNLIVEDNWFDGGEYCVNNADSNVTGSFARNRFGRQIAHNGTSNSNYFALMLSAPGLNTHDSDSANRNVWEDTGATVYRKSA